MGSPRIIRPEAPAVLKEHARDWTDELLKAYHRWEKRGKKGEKPAAKRSRYSHQQVRATVLTMYHGLCCYCESPLEETSFLRVEHYKPKGGESYMHLAYAWENLHAACEMCNGNKAEDFDDTAPPVIPTDHDPLDHIRYVKAMPLGKTANGNWTLEHCKFHTRTRLVERRAAHLKPYTGYLALIKRQVERAVTTGVQPSSKARVLIEEAFAHLRNACLPSAPWSTMVRSEVAAELLTLEGKWTRLIQATTV